MSKLINAVDLFCGAGGLTHGLQMSDIDVKLGIDIEPSCAYPFEVNNNSKFLLKSVADVDGNEISPFFSDSAYSLLAGCAPCQTFSKYNQKASPSDERWWLLLEFSRLVKETLPDFVTMENVPGLIKQDIFHEFIKSLENNGYSVCYRVINSADYGLPQNRRRLVLLASKLGDISILSPEILGIKNQNLEDAIKYLPPLEAGGIDKNDSLHQCSILSPLNIKRIRASKPGGTWKDWPEDLIAECHKKDSGKTYSGVYARMRWDKPAPTLTTQYFGFGNGRFGHPEQDRALSLREGAILQGFPKDYKFVPPNEAIKKREVCRMVGNAVPVRLGEIIGLSIKKHLEDIS
jgi:DNA (cytosine-5)-methyltransferase 1